MSKPLTWKPVPHQMQLQNGGMEELLPLYVARAPGGWLATKAPEDPHAPVWFVMDPNRLWNWRELSRSPSSLWPEVELGR